MNQQKFNFLDHEEEKIRKKYQKRNNKKSTMKVSGGEVKKLQRLIMRQLI